jgi:hypothetical protein
MTDLTTAAWLLLIVASGILVIAILRHLRRRRSVYQKQLPRIYELRDWLPTPLPPDAYFRDLDRSLAEIPQKLRQFRDIEADLQGLDATAWHFLKSELAPLLTARDRVRHWAPLFDKLNQAKAYNYLKKAGYAEVSFVPVSPVARQKTPDLRATAGAESALCEVKTINISDVEARRQSRGGPSRTLWSPDSSVSSRLILPKQVIRCLRLTQIPQRKRSST